MRKTFFLLFLSLLLFVRASTQNILPPVYEIKTDTAYITIPDSCWQMLENPDGKWTIDEVSQSPLSHKFHSDTDLNSSVSTYWTRFMLKNNMAHEARIYFNGNRSFFDLYTRQGDSLWQHQKTGYFLPWSKRDGIKNNYCIPSVIGPGQELLVYQRLKFELQWMPKRLDDSFGFTEKMISNSYVFYESEYFDNIRRGVTFGICMLAALFSFFFFLTAREWVYFHAAMLYFSSALFGFITGFADIFFRENKGIIFSYGQDFIIPTFLYFLVSTVRHSLGTKRQYPLWNRFLIILSILPIIWLLAKYFHPSLIKWLSDLALLIFLAVVITCFRWMNKKNKTAQLLIAGVLFFSFFEIVLIGQVILNISLPVWLAQHSLDIELICFFWIIATSSWMLFQRFRQMQKKLLQEAFEKEQMAKEKEIERRQLVEQQKLELEKTVTERTAELKQSLEELKSTQAQLIQSEKMASLGELTAGIAHEIQNPLNFVNNFSEVSNELLDEMKEELATDNKQSAMEIAGDVKQNLEKILHHGKRADAIVKGMLQHSRNSSGQKEPTDINALADEYLRLAYHGLRAKDKSFNAQFETSLDNSIGKINVVPQELGRVILNLINNAFYAVAEKKQQLDGSYEPIVSVSTKKLNDKIEIQVKDNGNGIPEKLLDKIFQPFFTTKPTGEGTGLGLSLSYDIITKGHGGELKVQTNEGQGSSFIILLPNHQAS